MANTTVQANLRVAYSPRFAGYLTDALGQALYMFAGDVSGSQESACLGACAQDWPAFDVDDLQPGAGIAAADISRFHRQDGAWQTAYKGHALYYRAAEAATHDVAGDGSNQRWFVARDYFAFVSLARTFTPAGGTATDDTFLTDGNGRTLYVCLDDRPRTSTSDAVSSCDAGCTRKRPVLPAPESLRALVLPSSIDAAELGVLARADGLEQLTYRGWPLYYFSGDTTVGSTEGHNDRAWRAIDPITFGRPDVSSDN